MASRSENQPGPSGKDGTTETNTTHIYIGGSRCAAVRTNPTTLMQHAEKL